MGTASYSSRMSTTLLLASALIPAFFLLWFLCSRDAQPEPPRVVISTFLLGAVVTLPIIPLAWGLEGLGHAALGMWPKALVGGFLGAAIPEEGFKFLVLRGWVWRQKEFDEPMDGIVYGAAASLGFAALENALYVSGGGFGVATLRAVTAVPGHAITGVVMGYYAGRAKFAPKGSQLGLLAKGVGGAMLLHGLYDTFLLTGSLWAFFAVPVLIFQFLWARRLIAEMRAEQAGLLLQPIALPALQPSLPMALPSARSIPPRQASAFLPMGPRHRTVWGLLKTILGAIGASAGALFLLACALTAIDTDLDAVTKGGLVLAAIGTAIATSVCLLLFRSGLRGPFMSSGDAGLAAPQ